MLNFCIRHSPIMKLAMTFPAQGHTVLPVINVIFTSATRIDFVYLSGRVLAHDTAMFEQPPDKMSR